MQLSWSAWVLVICAIVSLVAILFGVVRAALAAAVVKRHADVLTSALPVGDLAELEAYMQRINGAVEGIRPLIARGQAAVQRIDRALRELRMPEAIAALRLAGASLRLLFGRFPTPR